MSTEAGTRSSPQPGVGDLLNHAPGGFLSFRDDGRVELVNRTLLDMLGHDTDELTGRHIESVMTVGTRIFYQTHWFPLLRMQGHAEEIFLMMQSKAREPIGVLVNAVRRERAGDSAYDCIIVRVREREKFEAELLRARRIAEAAQKELEKQKRELEDKNFLLGAQNTELEAQQLQLQEQAAELEATSEELMATNDMLLERTEDLMKARETAEEANRAKSTFLAVMSHELRTPLNAISGYAELMDMGIHGPVTDAQREALARIKRSQRHLLRLINEVLNLARIEAGHVDYRTDDLSLAAIVADVTPMVEPQMAEKQLAFHTRVPDRVMVRGDRDKIQQILLNLLGNAVKFTAPGGSVTVSAGLDEATPDAIRLSVTDTGMGIPDAIQASVFEPFVQVDASHSGRKEGTGLGLAISRDLARGMGGELEVRSVVGEGSTFTLTLPRPG